MCTVFLVGFMGCGKSTAGRNLAARLELPFVDLDEEIERTEGTTIAEIFERRGERAFRAAETRTLMAQTMKPPAVVATGGGLFCEKCNRGHIDRAGGKTVFLDVPWDVIEERIGTLGDDRPLWRDRAAARRLYAHRLPTYQLADVVVALQGDETPAEVAEVAWRGLSEVSCVT